MYKRSEFSNLTGLSKDTLRYYAEVGLLEPAFIHPENKYRYYDDGSYFLALLLGKLRRFGFSIQEMKTVMDDESFASLEELLAEKKSKMEQEAEDIQARIKELDAFIQSGKEENE
ncbi:MerR family transcriptional regulator [Halobacillus kuroshimensis]|uniref:MerR family transcriptional regulator n=1 Tax=Halobacillus kuroshimensis TaxID=302481 RepID=A0ABS3DU40_9BACI|nr:MerR family transcriptional regulator [Halobacillus kuroshimensis]MBN8234854.1 MerR family transcriptional regulator [Halobacillus kuroshimensis]